MASFLLRPGARIEYNTVSDNAILDNGSTLAHCGIYEYSVSGRHNVYYNNLTFGNSGGDYCFKTGSQSGGISVDPSLGTTFVNWQLDGSGDYRLKVWRPGNIGRDENLRYGGFRLRARPWILMGLHLATHRTSAHTLSDKVLGQLLCRRHRAD